MRNKCKPPYGNGFRKMFSTHTKTNLNKYNKYRQNSSFVFLSHNRFENKLAFIVVYDDFKSRNMRPCGTTVTSFTKFHLLQEIMKKILFAAGYKFSPGQCTGNIFILFGLMKNTPVNKHGGHTALSLSLIHI